MAEFFADQTTLLGEPCKEVEEVSIGVGAKMPESFSEPKLKYSRRRFVRRNCNKYGGTKTRSLLSKMNLSLVPLKRNLFQGNGGKKWVSADTGGFDKARNGSGDHGVV